MICVIFWVVSLNHTLQKCFQQVKPRNLWFLFHFFFFFLHLVIFNYIFHRVMKDFGCRTPSALKLSDRLWATFSYYETALFISEVRGFFLFFWRRLMKQVQVIPVSCQNKWVKESEPGKGYVSGGEDNSHYQSCLLLLFWLRDVYVCNNRIWLYLYFWSVATTFSAWCSFTLTFIVLFFTFSFVVSLWSL